MNTDETPTTTQNCRVPLGRWSLLHKQHIHSSPAPERAFGHTILMSFRRWMPSAVQQTSVLGATQLERGFHGRAWASGATAHILTTTFLHGWTYRRAKHRTQQAAIHMMITSRPGSYHAHPLPPACHTALPGISPILETKQELPPQPPSPRLQSALHHSERGTNPASAAALGDATVRKKQAQRWVEMSPHHS